MRRRRESTGCLVDRVLSRVVSPRGRPVLRLRNGPDPPTTVPSFSPHNLTPTYDFQTYKKVFPKEIVLLLKVPSSPSPQIQLLMS